MAGGEFGGRRRRAAAAPALGAHPGDGRLSARRNGSASRMYDLTPAAHSLDDIARSIAWPRESGRSSAYHLKIDSGMDRLGTRAAPEEIVAALPAGDARALEGLMTHFASAADYTSRQTEAANRLFFRGHRAAPARRHWRRLTSTCPAPTRWLPRNPAWLTWCGRARAVRLRFAARGVRARARCWM